MLPRGRDLLGHDSRRGSGAVRGAPGVFRVFALVRARRAHNRPHRRAQFAQKYDRDQMFNALNIYGSWELDVSHTITAEKRVSSLTAELRRL